MGTSPPGSGWAPAPASSRCGDGRGLNGDGEERTHTTRKRSFLGNQSYEGQQLPYFRAKHGQAKRHQNGRNTNFVDSG